MKIQTTSRFDRDYARLPQQIQARTNKQLALLLSNSRHRSLRIEKAEGYSNIWKGRITREYRFTFTIKGDTYILRRVGTHDVYKNP
jgi:mRNA-degrading endonuclease RelE of RelBE toxin-antitoxin system